MSEVELRVSVLDGDAIVLGAFQRKSEIDVAAPPGGLRRRVSGGPALRAAAGNVHVQLRLARVDALVPCDVDRLLNRHVRPILRALTRVAAPAHYFGRDTVAIAHRPVAWIGFAHERSSGRVVVEAMIAVSSPFSLGTRASDRGRVPWTLEEATGGNVQGTRVAEAVVDAFASTAKENGRAIEVVSSLPEGEALAVVDEPPWAATREEAIGIVAAGRDHSGTMRVGGELIASSDAVRALEDEIARLGKPSLDDLSGAVDAAFTAPGTALFGVRSLASIRGVLATALES